MWHSKRHWPLSTAALLLMAGAAQAGTFSETFESYALGQLDGQGSWHGWDGNNTPFATVVTAQNHTGGGSQSAALAAGADSVTEFSTFTSGHYVLTAWTFAPTNFVGKTYFIVLNAYQNGGPYQWSVQIGFNGDTSFLECDCGDPAAVTRPLVRNAWIDIKVDIDLDNDVAQVFYNTAADPNPIATYPWSQGVFGNDNFTVLAIDAIDLYPDAPGFPNVTTFFVDDIEIGPAGPQPVGSKYCFGDGSASPCPCGNGSVPGAEQGCLNGSGQGAEISAIGTTSVGANDIVFTGDNLLPSQPALLFVGENAVNAGNGVAFGDGLRCAGGNVVRLGVKIPNATGDATWGPGLGTTGGWTNGDTRRFQVWYRNPGTSPCGLNFNLSHGLEISFTP